MEYEGITIAMHESIDEFIAEWAIRKWGLVGGSKSAWVRL